MYCIDLLIVVLFYRMLALSVASLSYNIVGGNAFTVYALNGEPLRLNYPVPSFDLRNAGAFTWNIVLANGSPLLDLDGSLKSPLFNITSGDRISTLTIRSFDACLVVPLRVGQYFYE